MIATGLVRGLFFGISGMALGLTCAAQTQPAIPQQTTQPQQVHLFAEPADARVENGSGYYGVRDICTWGQLRGDPGGTVPAETRCREVLSRVLNPGFSLGNPDSKLYPGEEGWQHNIGEGIKLDCLTAGMCSGISVSLLHPGVGDSNTVDVLTTTKWGGTAPSDEGVTSVRSEISESASPYGGTVAELEHEGGQTTITLESVKNAEYLAPSQPLVDLSKVLLARQKHKAGGAGEFATMELTGPDGKPLAKPLPISTCATIQHPVVTGWPQIRNPYTVRITSWQAAKPENGAASFTFSYVRDANGRGPRKGDRVYLDGFANGPADLNGSVVQVVSATETSFTASVFYKGEATAILSEPNATVRLWSAGRIPAGGVSTMTVTVSKPFSGPGFDANGVVFLEDIFPEQTVPAAAPERQADGTVVLHLPLRYEHAAGKIVCQGGLAGYRVNMPDYSGQWSTYVQYISGSTSGHEIREGFVRQGRITAFPRPGAVQIMPGTDVVSILNPKTGAEDSKTFVIQPPPGFARGDVLTEPNNIAGGAVGMTVTMATFSPYASYAPLNLQWPGATLGESYGITMNFHGNQAANVKNGYPGIVSEGGTLDPPVVLRAFGIAKEVVALNVPPDRALFHVGGCRDGSFTGPSRMYNLWEQGGEEGGTREGASLSYAPCSRDPREAKTLFLRGAGLSVEKDLHADAVSVGSLQPSRPVCTDAARGLTTNCAAAAGSAEAGANGGEKVVPYSPAPVFDPGFSSNVITLAGPDTRFQLAGGRPGQRETLVFCQDAAGSRTVSAPGNVRGFFTVGAKPNTCSSQSFVWSATLGRWLADSPGVVNE